VRSRICGPVSVSAALTVNEGRLGYQNTRYCEEKAAFSLEGVMIWLEKIRKVIDLKLK